MSKAAQLLVICWNRSGERQEDDAHQLPGTVIVGTLVVAGSALCYLNPMWAWLPGAMGAGLLYSGLTDSCVMGMMLSRMPWNQVKAAAA